MLWLAKARSAAILMKFLLEKKWWRNFSGFGEVLVMVVMHEDGV